MAMTIQPIRPSPVAATNVQNLEVACMATLQERVRCATYTGKLLFTSDHKGVLYVWNVGDATHVKFHGGTGVPINVLQGANEGNDVWLGFSDGDIAIMDIHKKNVGTRWKAHSGGVSSIVALTNSVWSGGVDFQIRKWGLSGEVLMAYSHHHTSIRWLCMVHKDLHGTQKMQMWSASNEFEVVRCSILDSRLHHDIVGDIKKGVGHTLAILILCQVGKSTIWSGSEDNLIKVWSTLDVSLKHTLQGHKGPVCSMVEMGLHVWSGSVDATILVWDAATYSLLFSLGDQGGYVKAMIKADWQLWAFSSGKNIKVWAAASLWETSKSELAQIKDKMNQFLREKSISDNDNIKFKEDVQIRQNCLKESIENYKKRLEVELTRKENETQYLNEDHSKTLDKLENVIKALKIDNLHLIEERRNLQNVFENFKKATDLQEESNKNNYKKKLQEAIKLAQEQLEDTQRSQTTMELKFESTVVKALKIEITQLVDLINTQKNEIVHLTTTVQTVTTSYETLQGKLVCTKNRLESEGVKSKQQMVTGATGLAILKQMLQKDVEDAIKVTDNETSNLKRDLSYEKAIILEKNLDAEDLVNLELIQLIELSNKERADAERVADKAANRTASQTALFLAQLNKERKTAEEALQTCEEKWNNEHSILKRNLKAEPYNSNEVQKSSKKIIKEMKTKNNEIKKLHTTVGFLQTNLKMIPDLQRDLATSKDQLQIALAEATQIAKDYDKHKNETAELQKALESTNEALDAVNAAYFLSKQCTVLSQQQGTNERTTKNQTRRLELQVEEIKSQAHVASKLAEELVHQLTNVKRQFEDVKNLSKAVQYFANGIAVDDTLDQGEGPKVASNLAEEVEALKTDLESAWNNVDDLSLHLKDAQTQAEIARRLANAAHAEFLILLENVRQTCHIEEPSAIAESTDKRSSKQLEGDAKVSDNLISDIQGLKIQIEAATRLFGSAEQILARCIREAKRLVEAACSHALNVAADAKQIIAGFKGQIKGLEFALSNMSQGEDAENLDAENLVAERDELLQKLAENAEKAASDADVVAELKDSLAKVAAEKQSLESELNIAQDAYNSRYTSGKAPSKRYSAAALQQSNPTLPLEDIGIQSNIAGSRRNSALKGGASARESLSGPQSKKTSSVVGSRKNSTAGPSSTAFDFSGAILDGGLPKSLARATSAVGKSRKVSSAAVGDQTQRPSLLAQSNTGDLVTRASILAENNADILAQRASILAENNAYILAEKASMLAENTADVLAQRASVLAETTAEALADTASVLAENTSDILAESRSQRASMLALEALPPRASLLGQRTSLKRVSGTTPSEYLTDVIPRVSLRRLSAGTGGASRRSSSAMLSKRPSTSSVMPGYFVQDLSLDDLGSRKTLVVNRPSTSRRNSSKLGLGSSRRGSGVLPDQLQEKLEHLESEIMEAKRNSFLGGSFNENVDVEEFGEYDQPTNNMYNSELIFPSRRASAAMLECGGRRYSSIPSGIAAEVGGGGSRSSTRSGSSRGSRLVEEAANVERIANLKSRVSILECERERERVSALEASKAYDKSDEMMRRIQQLELALQQAHEDYKILSNETKQLHCRRTSLDREDREDRCTNNKERDNNNRSKCPQDLLRDLECDIDKKRSDLEYAEFSMQKVVEKYGRCMKAPFIRSTPYIIDGPTVGPPNICNDGTPSIEFTHLKMGHPTRAPSEMVTFTTSGPMEPQLVRIVEQVGKNLPQIIMREVGKIAQCCDMEEKKSPRPCIEQEPSKVCCSSEPVIIYQPAPKPCTHDEEVQTESPLIRFKEKERFLSGHGPYRVDHIKGY